MAKIALIFLVVFCIVQLSLAARLARDAPAADKPAIDTSQFDSLLTKATDQFKDIFSEQNLQKARDGLSQLGDTLKSTAEQVKNKLHDATAPKTT